MAKNLYRAWAQNEAGASADVANRETFTGIYKAEASARAEFGPGWMVKIDRLITDENGHIMGEERVKEFTIRERKGSTPIYGKKMKQTAVWLPGEMADWLKAQPKTMSEVIRELIEKAM